jgi:hypothetical protein
MKKIRSRTITAMNIPTPTPVWNMLPIISHPETKKRLSRSITIRGK